MKAARIAAIALAAYVGLVAAFELLIGVFQPANESTLVITTSDAEGETRDRVLSRIESGGQLYVAANHWPRAWYDRALSDPDVWVTIGGERTPRRAVPVADAEHARVDGERSLGFGFRVLTGFPPRKFLRLDPR